MKHLLLEIEVSDLGQNSAAKVAYTLEDAIYMHMQNCDNGDDELRLFTSQAPRIRVLTEDNPT